MEQIALAIPRAPNAEVSWISRLSPPPSMPTSVLQALPRNKEKSYHNYLQKMASGIWMMGLRSEPALSGLGAYVHLHITSFPRRWLFKPDPYLRAKISHQLLLLRLRIQSCPSQIPTHMRYSRAGHRPDYSQRFCPSALMPLATDATWPQYAPV